MSDEDMSAARLVNSSVSAAMVLSLATRLDSRSAIPPSLLFGNSSDRYGMHHEVLVCVVDCGLKIAIAPTLRCAFVFSLRAHSCHPSHLTPSPLSSSRQFCLDLCHGQVLSPTHSPPMTQLNHVHQWNRFGRIQLLLASAILQFMCLLLAALA